MIASRWADLKATRARHSALAPVAWALLVLFGSYASGQDKVPSLETLTAEMARQQARIGSLRIDFGTRSVGLEDAVALRKYLRIMGYVNEKTVFAFKGNMRYQHKTGPAFMDDIAPGVEEDWDAIYEPREGGGRGVKKGLDDQKALLSAPRGGRKKPAEMPLLKQIPIDPEREFGFDGDKLRSKNPKGRSGGILPPEQARKDELYFTQEYLSAIGMKLPDPFKTANDRKDERFPDAFARRGFRVGAALERIDGHPCVVVSRDGKETVWIDPAIGYAVRKHSANYPDTDLLREVYHNTDFQEVAPGLWLPRRCAYELCGPPLAPVKYRGKPMLRFIHDVKKFSLNDVPDSLFTLSFEPGMIINDTTGGAPVEGKPPGLTYIMPADLTQLDRVVNEARTSLEEAEAKAGNSRLYLGITIAVVGAAIFASAVLRYRGLRPRHQPAGIATRG
jgi:hypothetical protein